MNFPLTGHYFKQKLLLNAWSYRILPIVLWMVFALLPFLMPAGKEASRMNNGFVMDIFCRNLFILLIFYIHSYLIFPLRKKTFYYFTSLVLLGVCFVIISHHFRPKRIPFKPDFEIENSRAYPKEKQAFDLPPRPFAVFFNLPPFLATILCSYCYCLLLGFNKREMLIKEKENAQLKTELSFLRSQISPHFMFNVLNSMVSLARKKSELLEPALINLSALMRYMLYQRNGQTVFLKTEVEYLQNYIDLQLLRYGDIVKLNLYINGKFDAYQIEPMLLLPFVENAFKHGISMVKDPLIDISVKLNQETGTLEFVVLNSISPVKDRTEGETGIGLQNIRRRLELLYPGQYKLNQSNQNKVFKTEVIIALKGNELSDS